MSASLAALFKPRSVAVIGASERPGSVGRLVFENLLAAGFPGAIHAVNPRHETVLGHPCVGSVEDIDGPVDLVALCIPAERIERVLRQCARKGVGAAIIHARNPAQGQRLARWQQRIRTLARNSGIRLLGPNSMGLWRARQRLNLLYNRNRLQSGPVALVSQSAGLCDALLDWCEAHGRGFSTVLTPGEALDVDLADAIRYLALEPDTRLILVYMEHIEAARAPALIAALRLAAAIKPVLVFSGGPPEEACLEGAILSTGAVLLHHVGELFPIIDRLLAGQVPASDRPLLIGNATGPDFLALNRLHAYGLEPAEPSERLLKRLRSLAPVRTRPGLVLPATLDAGALARCLDAVAEGDGLAPLLLLTPRPETDAEALVRTLIDRADHPPVTCLMGEQRVASARTLAREAGLALQDSPAAAVDVFASLTAWRRQQALVGALPEAWPRELEQPLATIAEECRRLAAQPERIDRATTLQWLERLGLRCPPATTATSLDEARARAEDMGWPLRLRPLNLWCRAPRQSVATDPASLRHHYLALFSAQQTCRDRSPVRGVLLQKLPFEAERLGLRLAVRRHPVWRSVLEASLPQARVPHCLPLPIGPAQLDVWLAHAERRPLEPLRDWLLRLSALIARIPECQALMLDEIYLDEEGPLLADARLELAPVPEDQPPYGHLLIHPWPPERVRRERLEDGSPLLIRPLRPEDARNPGRFTEQLSPESLRQRFLHPPPALTPELIAQLSILDLHREHALLALAGTEEEPAGVARYTCRDGAAEFAILVADRWQGHGIGRRLMEALMETARAYGCRRMYGLVLADNRRMLAFAGKLGFRRMPSEEPGVVRIERTL
ncbi:MAG: GNAT family N-acetyltransferase [Gammaproteobacteria bacterium]|nr:MAG: GNAT family N-acetyltransferase [Gammaproteobacteria bacterium]